MKTAYLACLALALTATTYNYIFTTSTTPLDALATASTAVASQPCLVGGRADFIGFNSYLAH